VSDQSNHHVGVVLIGYVACRCENLYISSSVIGIAGRLTSMGRHSIFPKTLYSLDYTGLFTLRTWAIYQEKMTVLISLIILALLSFALDMAALFGRVTLVKGSVPTTSPIIQSLPYGYLAGPCGTDMRLKVSTTYVL